MNTLMDEVLAALRETRNLEKDEVVGMEEDGTYVVETMRMIPRTEAEMAIQKINSVKVLLNQMLSEAFNSNMELLETRVHIDGSTGHKYVDHLFRNKNRPY